VFGNRFSIYVSVAKQKKRQIVFHEEAVKAITTCGEHGSTPSRASPAEVEIIDNPPRSWYIRAWPKASFSHRVR
jgi:hypothetical protein